MNKNSGSKNRQTKQLERETQAYHPLWAGDLWIKMAVSVIMAMCRDFQTDQNETKKPCNMTKMLNVVVLCLLC